MDGRARGIDVSHHNSKVNWAAAAAAGIQFGFAKASEGGDPRQSSYTDATFATNWQGMLDNGVIRGAYHFVGLPLATTAPANWNDDLHRQIDHFLGMVGPLQPGDLAPTLDFENGDSPKRWAQLLKTNRAGALAIVRELIDYTTAQLDGIVPIIYTGSFWRNDLGNPTATTGDMPYGNHPLWIPEYPQIHTPIPLPGLPGQTDLGEALSFAEYTAKLDGRPPTHIPTLWAVPATPQWTFWQFTSMGQIPTLCSTRLDLNVFNGTLEQLSALCIPPPPPPPQ